MTASTDEIIPGLDHSLYKAGGLLFWQPTPGFVTPPRRINAKRRTTKTDARRNDGASTGQKVIWEDMA